MPRLLLWMTALLMLGAPVSARKIPKFQVDPSWPSVPKQWQLGQVSSVAVDARDHVWILQRPATLAPEEKSKAAPPVLEFDPAGIFVKAWGGPGAGYQWPNSEHGIHIDPKGFVWIGGNGTGDHHSQVHAGRQIHTTDRQGGGEQGQFRYAKPQPASRCVCIRQDQ